MILGYVGRRHEYCWFTQETKLRYRTRSRSRNHQVGNIVSIIHLRNEIRDKHSFGIKRISTVCSKLNALLGYFCFYCRKIIFARLPHYLAIGLQQRIYVPSDTIVYSLGSERPSDDEYRFLIPLQSEIVVSRLPVYIGSYDILSYGIACFYYFSLVEKTLHTVVCNTYFTCFFRQKTIGNTCKRVLLLQHNRDTKCRCRRHSRCRYVTSHTDSYIGAKRTYYLPCLTATPEKVVYYPDVSQHFSAFEPLNIEPHNVVTRLGNTLHFHSAVGSDKKYFAVGLTLSQRIGNTYGRENMSTRAPSTYQKPHFIVCFFFELI